MANHVEIEGIFAPDCGSRDDTLNLINKVIDEMSIAAEVREKTINTAEEAAEYHFLGSPSVRIDGVDIDPEAKDRDDYGLG
jgi:hypothetical protein